MERMLESYIVSFIGLFASVATIILLLKEFLGHNEKVKVFSYLALTIILCVATTSSIIEANHLRDKNTNLKNNALVINSGLVIVNKIMSDIEKFNSSQSLPNNSEEAIANFEYSIREAAKKLKKLERNVYLDTIPHAGQ